jgi:hypothetical protein
MLSFCDSVRLTGCGKMGCLQRFLGNYHIRLTRWLLVTALQAGFCSDFAGFCPGWADSGHGYARTPTSLGSRTRL